MAHTSGPWKLLRSVDGFAGATSDKDIGITAGGIIAEAFYRIDDYEYADVEANARLIAAAPELLEALKACLPVVQYILTNGWDEAPPIYTTFDEFKANELAVKAIAKAEGGSNG